MSLFQYLKSLLTRKIKLLLIVNFFLKLVLIGLSLIPPFIIMFIFDDILPSFNLDIFLKLLLVLIIFFLTTLIFEIFIGKLQLRINKLITKEGASRVLSNVISNEIYSIRKFDDGDLIYRCKTDVENIAQKSLRLSFELPVNSILLICLTILMLQLNVVLAIASTSFFVMEMMYTYTASKKFKKKSVIVKRNDSKVLESLKQIFNRMLFVKINKLENYEINKHAEKYESFIESQEGLIYFQTKNQSVLSFLSNARQMLIIAFGAFLISQSILTVGVMLAFVQIVNRTSAPLNSLYYAPFAYKDIVTSYERIKPFIRSTRNNTTVEFNPNSEIHLYCKDISYRINERNLIDNLTLVINKGERICIVGKSGSGKSTLCNILAGVYSFKGEVYLNDSGKDQMIGAMLDECSLIKGTVKENLTYGHSQKSINDNQINYLLNQVGLNNLHLDKVIDKNTLSRGEQQRLEMVRLMLIKPRLIILDEPTSALDEITEKSVWNQFLDICKDSTIIYTTHKFNIIKNSHRILELNTTDKKYKQIN